MSSSVICNRDIFLELGLDEFKTMRNNLKDEIVLIKFSATWCNPCKKIKDKCEEWFKKLPSNVFVFDIDIDETMDLYMAFKKWKMVNGVPSILAFYTSTIENRWYIPDDSVNGGNIENVNMFFLRCESKAFQLKTRDSFIVNDYNYLIDVRKEEEDSKKNPKEIKLNQEEEIKFYDNLYKDNENKDVFDDKEFNDNDNYNFDEDYDCEDDCEVGEGEGEGEEDVDEYNER